MSEMTVNLGGNQTWVVPGTDEEKDATDVNQYYQAMAISMNLAADYGDRITAQADSVSEDTVKLAAYSDILAGGWPTTVEGQIAATQSLVDLNQSVNMDSARVKAKDYLLDTTSTGVSISVPTAYALPPTSIMLFDPNVDNLDTYGPLGVGLYGAYENNADKFQEGVLYQTRLSPLHVNDPVYEDWTPVKFVKYQGVILVVENDSDMTPYMSNPSQANLIAAQPAIKKAVSDLTQVSQGKQAFLQDLMASMAKFMDLATNLVQRDERNRQDIIGRF